MKNMLLVYPHCLERNIRPPLGIGYIASFLRKKIKNIKIRIIDLTLYNNWKTTFEELLKEFKPNVIGFSVPTVAYTNAKELAEIAKKFDFVEKIIFGGPHPSACTKSVLEENPDTIIVKGEGEITMYEIAKEKRLDTIKGISFVKNGKIIENSERPFIEDLNILPFPARDLMELEKYKEYFQNFRFTTIMSSRGCPFRCIYCCKATLGTRWIPRNPENIIKEIVEIKKIYGIENIFFHDDLFTFSEERILKFCDLLERNNLKLKWQCVTRVDRVSRKLLKRMKDVGCFLINFGVETGNQKIMNSIRKGITLEQAENAFKWCKEIGIYTLANFMIGLPEDTPKTIKNTIDFAKKLDPGSAQFTLTTPFPDTELWRIMEEEELIEKPVDWNFFRSYGLTSYDDYVACFGHKNIDVKKLFQFVKIAEKEFKKYVIIREIKRLHFLWISKGLLKILYKKLFEKEEPIHFKKLKNII